MGTPSARRWREGLTLDAAGRCATATRVAHDFCELPRAGPGRVGIGEDEVEGHIAFTALASGSGTSAPEASSSRMFSSGYHA